jgi:hypothetical protein
MINFSRKWAHHFNERTQSLGHDWAAIERVRADLKSAFPHRVALIVQDGAKIGNEYLFVDGSRFATYFSEPGKLVFGSIIKS